MIFNIINSRKALNTIIICEVLNKVNKFKNIDSKILLRKSIELIHSKGYLVNNIDSSVCLEEPKIAKHIPEMQKAVSEICEIDLDAVSIKATTNEKMGFIGRKEGITAYAVVLLIGK